jgi:hypothetical protein
MTPPIRRKGPGSAGATEGANPPAQEAKPQGITEQQLTGVLAALKKPPPRMSGAGASTASRPVRVAAPVENSFARMNLTVPLPKPAAMTKTVEFDFNRIIDSLLKNGFPKEILDAMNKVKPLSVAMALPNFEFSAWVKETTATLDTDGKNTSTAPNGRKHTDVIRAYTDVLKEYDHITSFSGANSVKNLRRQGLTEHLYKTLTEAPIDTRSNSVEDLVSTTAISIGVEQVNSHLEAIKISSGPELAAKVEALGDCCIAHPQVGKFLFNLLGQGEHRQFLAFLVTKSEAAREGFTNEVQFADILFDLKMSRTEKEAAIDKMQSYNLPPEAKEILNSFTEDDIKEIFLSGHKKEISDHLDYEVALGESIRTSSNFLPPTIRAELGVMMDKMTLSSNPNSSATRNKLPEVVGQACQLILGKGTDGAQDMSRVARTQKDIRTFRMNCVAAHELALKRIETLKTDATDAETMQRYENMEKSLKNGLALYSDNEHFSPREMDIISVSILAIEHPVGVFFPSVSPEPEELEKTLLLDAMKLTSNSNPQETSLLREKLGVVGVEYDDETSETKYLPKFSTEPEKNDMGKLEANLVRDETKGLWVRRT